MKPDEIRILVIEDNPNWVNKTRQILRHLGYANVKTAANAEDARVAFKEFDPHLAVVDIMLPEEEDGFDLICAFTQVGQETTMTTDKNNMKSYAGELARAMKVKPMDF
ncbi:MAG: response regulator [Kiritimatiellae bacterium]|nr:response regulator [Kiritimatiellia bacterium]